MSRYRKVLTRTWQDEKFLALPPDGQRVFLYHLTSPFSTPFLLYLEGPGSIADTLRLTSAKFRSISARLTDDGMVQYAQEGALRWVFLLKAMQIEENAPAGDNAVINYVKMFRELPSTPFRHCAVEHWRTLTIRHRGAVAFLDAISRDLGYDLKTGRLKASVLPSTTAYQTPSTTALLMPSERHASAGAVAVTGEGAVTGAVRASPPASPPTEVLSHTGKRQGPQRVGDTLHDAVAGLRREEGKA